MSYPHLEYSYFSYILIGSRALTAGLASSFWLSFLTLFEFSVETQPPNDSFPILINRSLIVATNLFPYYEFTI